MSMSSLAMASASASASALLAVLVSEETGVRGRRVRVVAKWPVWNLLRLRRRSPLEDLGSGAFYWISFGFSLCFIVLYCIAMYCLFVGGNVAYPLGRIGERAGCSPYRQLG